MPFVSCSVLRRGGSLALAPKKSVALQARRWLSPDVAPILGESGAGVTALLAGLVPPTVVPMPLVSQVVGKAEGAPSKVAAQPAMEVIPLPTSERAELLTAPVSSTAEGGTAG